jgi:hypothetical protein
MITAIGALKVADPKEWASTVKQAMKANGGRITDAAVALGVSPRTLFRWLALPPLENVAKSAPCLHVTASKKRKRG